MLTIAYANRGRPTLKDDERFWNRMDNFQTQQLVHLIYYSARNNERSGVIDPRLSWFDHPKSVTWGQHDRSYFYEPWKYILWLVCTFCYAKTEQNKITCFCWNAFRLRGRYITWANFSLGWKKMWLHGKFQPGLKLNVRAGTWEKYIYFNIYCCTLGFYPCVYEYSARAEILFAITWRNFQPGLKLSPGWN